MPAKKTKTKLKKKNNFVRNVLFVLGGALSVFLVINIFAWQKPPQLNISNGVLDSKLNPSEDRMGMEQKKIMTAAQKNVLNNEINGIQVKFVFGKQIGEYALVRAMPLHNETDPLQIVLQKVHGTWKVINSGTAFPELEGKVPSGLLD